MWYRLFVTLLPPPIMSSKTKPLPLRRAPLSQTPSTSISQAQPKVLPRRRATTYNGKLNEITIMNRYLLRFVEGVEKLMAQMLDNPEEFEEVRRRLKEIENEKKRD